MGDDEKDDMADPSKIIIDNYHDIGAIRRKVAELEKKLEFRPDKHDYDGLCELYNEQNKRLDAFDGELETYKNGAIKDYNKLSSKIEELEAKIEDYSDNFDYLKYSISLNIGKFDKRITKSESVLKKYIEIGWRVINLFEDDVFIIEDGVHDKEFFAKCIYDPLKELLEWSFEKKLGSNKEADGNPCITCFYNKKTNTPCWDCDEDYSKYKPTIDEPSLCDTCSICDECDIYEPMARTRICRDYQPSQSEDKCDDCIRTNETYTCDCGKTFNIVKDTPAEQSEVYGVAEIDFKHRTEGTYAEPKDTPAEQSGFDYEENRASINESKEFLDKVYKEQSEDEPKYLILKIERDVRLCYLYQKLKDYIRGLGVDKYDSAYKVKWKDLSVLLLMSDRSWYDKGEGNRKLYNKYTVLKNADAEDCKYRPTTLTFSTWFECPVCGSEIAIPENFINKAELIAEVIEQFDALIEGIKFELEKGTFNEDIKNNTDKAEYWKGYKYGLLSLLTDDIEPTREKWQSKMEKEVEQEK